MVPDNSCNPVFAPPPADKANLGSGVEDIAMDAPLDCSNAGSWKEGSFPEAAALVVAFVAMVAVGVCVGADVE